MSSCDVALTAVVFGYRNEATVVRAVASLIQQECEEPFEVVVATSGADRTEELVKRAFPAVRVEGSPTRLLPGGVRNIGIRMARGEILAFLEADCIARPGWIAKRIEHHRAGHQAVAGAVGVGTEQSRAERATVYLCFGDRLGRTSVRPAQAWESYGLSFTRDLLDRAGPFDESLRAGEDTVMRERLAELGVTPWFDPSICIEHIGSIRLLELIKDQYARGRRRSRSDVLRQGVGALRLKLESKPVIRGLVVIVRAILRFWSRNLRNGKFLWRSLPKRRELLVTLPWLVLGQVSYAIGWAADQLEFVRADGYTQPPVAFHVETSLRRRVASYGEKVAALTFDDGPSDYTKEVLEVLRQYDVPGSFFVVGSRAASSPELIRSIADAGHTLGLHGWTHQSFTDLDDADIKEEIDRSRALILELTGREVRHVRPPYGNYDARVVAQLADRQLLTWLWTLDPRDWSPSAKADEVAAFCTRRLTAGSVILLHDGGGERSQTVAALPALIEDVLARRYRFVSLDYALGKPGRCERN